jgi:sialic acid synthase SpsE
MSTPFDLDAVDLLQRVGVDAIKIASGDVTHHQLIARAAATGKPLVISTGMSDLVEISDALFCARRHGATDVALLHCVSAYPVPPGDENLRAVATLAAAFGVPVGLSDHSTCPEAAVVATVFGASIYERHLVLGPESDSVDAAVSSTPGELASIARAAERARLALGSGVKCCSTAEQGNLAVSRRGLYATRSIPAGSVIAEQDLIALRPSTTIDARDWRRIVGARAARAIAAGEAFDAAAVPEAFAEESRRSPARGTAGALPHRAAEALPHGAVSDAPAQEARRAV